MRPGFSSSPIQDMNQNPYSWNRSFGGGFTPAPSPSAPIAAGPQCYTCSNGTPSDSKFNVTDMALVKKYRGEGYRCEKAECVERGGYSASTFGSFGAAFGGGQASSAQSLEINSPYAPFGTATGMSGRRQPASGGKSLGDAPENLPLQFSYADAVAWLASAEKLTQISPICQLPIMDRFRSFVASTPPSRQGTALWTFSAEDSQGMADFVACTEKAKPHVADYDWRITNHVPEALGAALALGLLAWAVLS